MSERSAQQLMLVRHADAGSRASFDGPDEERPLTKRGRAQASALAELLGARKIGAIVSSPARRCVETVTPLAQRFGLEIEVDDALREEGSASGAIDALVARGTVAPGIVVGSTHGPIFEDLLESIGGRFTLAGPRQIAKGGRIELTVTDGELIELATFHQPEIER